MSHESLEIIKGYGSRKTNVLFNLINAYLDIYKTFLYTKDPCEAKYKFSNTRESTRVKQLNDSKAFIEY